MLSTRFVKRQFVSKAFLSEPVFHLERRRRREANLEFSPTNTITSSQWLNYYGRSSKTGNKRSISWNGFQLSFESNPRLLWFCITTLCNWLTKLAPLSQPMGIQTKTNRVLAARVFPRLVPVTCI